MKIGIYCRVSTEEQKTKGVSIDDQQKRGIEFCKRNEFQFEVFDDGGYSGELAPENRPSLNRLLEKIYLDEIQGIWAVDFDRISRDEKFGFVLKKTLLDQNIKLFDSHGEINLNDETQDLLLGIKILLSSFELKKLRVRIKRSLERSVSEGKVGGGPMLNYGFQKGENKMLEINDIEAEVVKLIYQLAIEGKGTKVISNYLNDNNIPTKRNTAEKGYMMVKGESKTKFLWRDAVIYRILTNSIYKGKRLYKGKEYDCPRIIEPSKFDLVQQLLKDRKHFKDTTNTNFYLLKGLIHCGQCKSRFYGKKRTDGKGNIVNSDNHYTCGSQRYKKEWCGTKGINIDYMDDLVLTQMKTLEKDIEAFFKWYQEDDMNRMVMMALAKARKTEVTLNTKISNLLELGLGGNIKTDLFNSKMEQLNNELEAAKNDKAEQLNKLSILDKKDDILRVVNEHLENLQDVDLSESNKQTIIRSLIDKIYVQWNDNLKTHTLTIDYKIDNLTQYNLGKNIDLTYDVAGYRMDRKKLFTQNLWVRKLIVDGKDAVGMPVVSIK